MNLKRLTVILTIGAIGLVVSLGLRHYVSSRKMVETRPVDPQTMQEMLQRRGEKVMREKLALSLIAVYEPLLSQYPDNLDLKKKLADAYEEAGEHEKAQRLLEEIKKSIY